MEDYPRDQLEFESRFASEEACRDYLFALRWPDGFRCPGCGHERAWPVRKVWFECARCGRQTSVTAGTILQDTRKPLRLWFRAMWHVTSQKHGASALGLQRVLGLGSYQTAWTWMHKLRRAMVRAGARAIDGRRRGRRELLGHCGRGRYRQADRAQSVDCGSRGGARRRVGTDPHAARQGCLGGQFDALRRGVGRVGQRGCDRRLGGLRSAQEEGLPASDHHD